MLLYFNAGHYRLALDTDEKTWNSNHEHLGTDHDYIPISTDSMKKIIDELNFNNWDYDDNFGSHCYVCNDCGATFTHYRIYRRHCDGHHPVPLF